MRDIILPLSKSVVARKAMMAAISGKAMPEAGGSEDGEVITEALTCGEERVDVRSSGTAARFAIAYWGSRGGRKVIDGSEQMRRRPVGAMVDAMRRLGARIEYLGEEGRLPVRIDGCVETGSEVEAEAVESSQTISALMLIGAERGLRIEIRGDMVSSTYIGLTRKLMESAGVKVRCEEGSIEVERGEYRTIGEADRDWSSAVFWYGMVAVGEEDELLLRGLRMGSGQPDEKAVEVFGRLGVESRETPEGVMIYRGGMTEEEMDEGCRGCPDMVPVLVATLCRKGVRFRISGLETLERKESRRGTVMEREMGKMGYVLSFDGEAIRWDGGRCDRKGVADASDDHRIAMALMVAGAEIENRECINKSYKGLEKTWKKP